MTRPGVEVVSRAAPPVRGFSSETGAWFVVGLAERGRTDKPVLVRNMSDYAKHFGARVSYGSLYDSLDVFFREGGTVAYVARVVGPAAVVDTVTFQTAALADAIAVDSLGAGATALSVEVVDGRTAGTFALRVLLDGVEVERSGDLADPAEAASWSTSSNYVRVRAIGPDNPAPAAATDLAGGNDDRAAVTDVHRVAALGLFEETYGRGQVSIPGATTADAHGGLLEHAGSHNRVALLDAPDSASDTTLIAAADAIRTAVGPATTERGALFAPWVVVPGVVRGTNRTVPPSAGAAGLIARSDSTGGNPNVPAAGDNGVARYAVDVSQAGWTGPVRQTLNEEGVNLFRPMEGGVRLYGYRTLVDPYGGGQPWLSLASARLRMAIEDAAERIGESFMFAQLDGRGHKVAEFNGALTGMLAGFWQMGALYGETSDEAFIVDTGPSVNTPDTLANNELRAAIGLRMSPFAEMVHIEIVKIPITEAL